MRSKSQGFRNIFVSLTNTDLCVCVLKPYETASIMFFHDPKYRACDLDVVHTFAVIGRDFAQWVERRRRRTREGNGNGNGNAKRVLQDARGL